MLAGKPVSMFSKPDADGNIIKSKLGGAQFLHDPIPGINSEDPDTEIVYVCSGTPEGYRAKVYGDDPHIPFVSMEGQYTGKRQAAWNLRRTYDVMWDLLEPERANAIDVNPAWLDEALSKEWFDLIINTVPAPNLCRAWHGMQGEVRPHTFVSQSISVANHCIIEGVEDMILYNGDPNYSWYRASNLFGVGSTEWSDRVKPPVSDLVSVKKPLRTDCQCYEDAVVRLGRYGTWTKGTLTHHAFIGARKAVEGL
jgi:hypothetical protein